MFFDGAVFCLVTSRVNRGVLKALDLAAVDSSKRKVDSVVVVNFMVAFVRICQNN